MNQKNGFFQEKNRKNGCLQVDQDRHVSSGPDELLICLLQRSVPSRRLRGSALLLHVTSRFASLLCEDWLLAAAYRFDEQQITLREEHNATCGRKPFQQGAYRSQRWSDPFFFCHLFIYYFQRVNCTKVSCIYHSR